LEKVFAHGRGGNRYVLPAASRVRFRIIPALNVYNILGAFAENWNICEVPHKRGAILMV
jgi:hypothetical protein